MALNSICDSQTVFQRTLRSQEALRFVESFPVHMERPSFIGAIKALTSPAVKEPVDLG